MRVMVVMLENHIGGIAVRSTAVAKCLNDFNIETLFVLPREHGELSVSLQKQGFQFKQIDIHRPSLKRLSSNLRWFFLFPLSVISLISIIRDEKVDIIHVNGLLNLQAPLAALLTRRKIVWHLANTLYPRALVKVIMPFIKRFAFIVTISDAVDRYFCGEQPNSNRRIVREPVDITKFSISSIHQEKIDNCRSKLGLIKEEMYAVGMVGNVVPVKGYEYLIQAIPLVLQQVPNSHFFAIGPIFDAHQSYYKELQQLANSLRVEGHISFLGKRKDIPELLSVLDIFALSSLAEGTPIAILEAMAMEKPVVATKVGGVEDLVVHYETGLLVDSRNPRSLADAIIELLSDPLRRTMMGKRGRERIEKLFMLDECVKAHREIYESVLIDK